MRRPNTQRRAFIRKTGATAGLAALATAFGGNSVAATETMELNQMGPTPEQMQKLLDQMAEMQIQIRIINRF